MATAKSKQIAKEIENARCLGNWQAIPELARRYKKHDPQGSIFAQTITAEATLSQLCSNDKRRQDVSSVHGHDTPGDIGVSPHLDAAKVKSLQLELQSILQANSTTTTDRKLAEQKEFAKIILARSYYETGDYKAALDIVQHLAFDKSSVSTGYNFILFLQARTIKAVCLEMTGDIASSIDSYAGIASLLVDIQSAKERVLIDWAEHGLYRGSLISLGNKNLAPPASILGILRVYQRITAAQNIAWRLAKRLNVARYSFDYLIDIYRQGKYTATAAEQTSGKQDRIDDSSIFVTEIIGLHTIYEKMLAATSTIPRPNQLNIPVLEYADQVAATIALRRWTPWELKGFVDILYRILQRTFNSARVTRHLFNALVTLGEYEEAHHAYRTYLFLIGLSSEAQDQSRTTGEALARDREGRNVPLPIAKKEQIEKIIVESRCKVDGAARRSLASQRSLEQECVEDILQTLLTGITMLYSSLYRSADAVELSELAVMIYELSSSGCQSRKNWTALGSRVYCIAGAANSYLASQVVDPVARPKYHEKAQKYLEKSVDIDPSNWRAYYQLALEQSEIRDTQKAMQSIGRALQLNPSDISSWHLLVLLCSCPVQGNLKRALEACQMGLERARELKISSQLENDNVFDLGALADFDESEQHILLQMTYTMLCAKLYGPEEALRLQQDVFATYTRIAVPETGSEYSQAMTGLYERPKGMVVSGSLENLSENTISDDGSSNQSPSREQRQHNGSTRLSQRSSSQSLKTSSDEGSNTPPPTATTQQSHNHKRLHPPHLHLFRSKSRMKARKDPTTNGAATNDEKKHASLYSATNGTQTGSQPGSLSSLQSAAAMSLSSTRSIVTQGDAQHMAPHHPTTRWRLRLRRSSRILCQLWLLSAAYFLQLGRLDEAQKAIEEAENINWTSHAGVWCMLGRLRLAEGNKEGAIASFQKGFACDQNDNDCKLWLAKTFMELDDLEVAEGLLDRITKETGWDNPDAWTCLGKIFSITARPDRAKDCFFYALELEQTQPIRPFSILPRCK